MAPPQDDLSSSQTTFPSSADSDSYPPSSSADAPPAAAARSSAPGRTSTRPMILYQPPTIWSILRGAAINVLLPFINGLMLGFGELFAHEAAFRLGWGGTRVFPAHRHSRSVGPGVTMQEDPFERKRRNGQEMDMLTALE